MATHSSILAWRIPWTEESLVGYTPWGHKESDTTEQLSLSLGLDCARLRPRASESMEMGELQTTERWQMVTCATLEVGAGSCGAWRRWSQRRH